MVHREGWVGWGGLGVQVEGSNSTHAVLREVVAPRKTPYSSEKVVWCYAKMAAYVERHEIAAKLTAAVNDTISNLPDDPYGAMVRCSSSPR